MPTPSLTPDQLTQDQRARIEAVLDGHGFLAELGVIFAEAGHELALVGGPVRDAVLGRTVNDFDFTTSATPEQIEQLAGTWADARWDVGREFGTIGLRKGEHQLEVTTYRTDDYDLTSRKPEVRFGDTLGGDLSRRDFTVNAMAIRLPSREFVDLFDGLEDLADRTLRTPVTPEQSFSDDPLRMMRAARFVAQLGFLAAPEVVAAMTDMASRMAKGVLQANGELAAEPLIDVRIVGQSVLYMANLPLDANVLFHTVMATKMPFVGRG